MMCRPSYVKSVDRFRSYFKVETHRYYYNTIKRSSKLH